MIDDSLGDMPPTALKCPARLAGQTVLLKIGPKIGLTAINPIPESIQLRLLLK